MPKFTRKIEDFICEHCGKKVTGTGYTNHCPYCLWSKHVDVHPGDRQEACGGMMQPIGFDRKGQDCVIIHRCETCGIQKKNMASKDDNFEVMLKLVPKDLP